MSTLAQSARRLLTAVDRVARAEASATRRQNGAMHPNTRATMLAELNAARAELRTILEAEGE